MAFFSRNRRKSKSPPQETGSAGKEQGEDGRVPSQDLETDLANQREIMMKELERGPASEISGKENRKAAEDAEPQPPVSEVLQPIPTSVIQKYRELQYPSMGQSTPDGKHSKAAPKEVILTDPPAAGEDVPRLTLHSDTSIGAAPGKGGRASHSGYESAVSPADFQSAETKGVQFNNAEAAAYAPAMIVTPADEMISQSAGLAAQASAQYFDSMSKVVMAAQTVMLKKLTEDIAAGDVPGAVEEGVGLLATEVILAGAMAVAAAGGAMDSAAAASGIEQINKAMSSARSVPKFT